MHTRYLKWLLLFCCLSIVPAVLLNVLLITHASDHRQQAIQASTWQQRTHGITLSPTGGNNGLFKHLRLIDRIPEINTVIFGASTVMAIDSTMLPAEWRLYNLSQSGNPLLASLGEAEYMVSHAPQITYYVIALDWALGFLYQPGEPAPADLSPAAINQALQTPPENIPLLALLRDALSYPRMERLGKILKFVLRSAHPAQTFREYFLQDSSDDYVCPDGSPGKDYDTYNRGSCNGFRYDGSATFSDYSRVNNAKQLVMGATASSSKYAHSLLETKGVVNQALLDHLARLNAALKSRGGQLVVFLPPLLPNMEKAFLSHPQYAPYLLTTKNMLNRWALQEQITLFDFGQSEHYGCEGHEFLDEHHATQTCYWKIFPAFWQNARKPDGTPLLRPGNTH